MIYYLSLSTFQGIAPGASHYWARLRFGDEELDVERDVYDEEFGEEIPSCCYDTREEALEAGIQKFKEIANRSTDILIRGLSAVLDPQEVLFAPNSVWKELCDLYDQHQFVSDLDPWGEDYVVSVAERAIFERWRGLIKMYEQLPLDKL